MLETGGTYCFPEAGVPLFSQKRIAAGSTAGFVLVDSMLNPISFNAEAVQILGYRNGENRVAELSMAEVTALLASKIHSVLAVDSSLGRTPFVTEFMSGRRRYVCRTFCVNSGATALSKMQVALFLERAPSKLIPLPEIARQFRLTQREVEVLGHLMQALSSKDIANRMGVSPSTVKAFLRTMMIKMGVNSRSAIVGKALMSAPLRTHAEIPTGAAF